MINELKREVIEEMETLTYRSILGYPVNMWEVVDKI